MSSAWTSRAHDSIALAADGRRVHTSPAGRALDAEWRGGGGPPGGRRARRTDTGAEAKGKPRAGDEGGDEGRDRAGGRGERGGGRGGGGGGQERAFCDSVSSPVSRHSWKR